MKSYLSLFCLLGIAAAPASAVVLFSNGDADTYGNFLDCGNCRAAGGVKIYDDFTVGPGGWTLTGLSGIYFIQQLNQAFPTNANWEIRQGIGQNNFGTLIASGNAATTISTPSFVPPASGTDTRQISISIAPLNLAPGRYWMTLAPNQGSDEPFLWAAAGANGVNSAINGESYVTGPYWPSMQNVGTYLQPFTHISSYDFAYQVSGTEGVPEPGSWLLLGSGLTAIGFIRRKR